MIPPLLALFTYPLFAVIFFSRMPLRQALICTLVLGYLFLPPKFAYDLPVLPALSKETVPALAALLCLILFHTTARNGSSALPGMFPRHPLPLICFGATLASIFLTTFTNMDQQIFGKTTLAALRPYDGFSALQSTLITVMPLLFARKYLADEAGHKLLLKIIAIIAAGYSLLILFEIIMSPQLNNIVYGYFPHSWKQHVREDGFRPLVFLKHGLWLSIFLCCSILAAIAFMRFSAQGEKIFYLLLSIWLFALLTMANSLGSWAIAVLLIPIVLFFNPRKQLLVAAIISGSLLFYPVLRGTDLLPVYQLADRIEQINPNRAGSFRYRLINEDQLLAKANERPLFGWGGYGRSRIFDENGKDVSTTDGFWIIRIGERGWVGYLSLVGLMCGPVLLLAIRRRQEISMATAGLSVVLAANFIDMVPNATLTILTMLIAGALAGRLEVQGTQVTTTGPPVQTTPTYSRFSIQGAAPTIPSADKAIKKSPYRAS